MSATKKTLGCWLLIGLTILAGCVPSLNAVYTEEDLVFDPALVGVWTQEGNAARWEFSKSDGKSYRLLYTDERGQQGRFIGHTIYRVRDGQGKLTLAAIDFKWLDEYLTSHPDEIECATFNGRKLITAPTAAVQKFVVAHKDRFTSEFPLQKQEPRN
jgi:hypothetical protein